MVEEEQGARQETAEMVGLPACQGDTGRQIRCKTDRANQERYPVANLTDIRMQYKWTGGVSERTDRLGREKERKASSWSV